MRSLPPPPGVQVNSVLKSLLHAFTHTQNTPVESDDEDIKPKFYQELSTNHFFVIFVGKKKKLENVGQVSFRVHGMIFAIRFNRRRETISTS